MKERSFRLAQYEIIEKGSGELWWKGHGGFAATKSGKCFIEGEVLFIGPSEIDEDGFLKNEFLEYLKQLPQWDRTKYYCPSYTLYTCRGGRVRGDTEQPTKREAPMHIRRDYFSVTPSDKTVEISNSLVSHAHISQVKKTLGEAFRRCKRLVGLSPEEADPED